VPTFRDLDSFGRRFDKLAGLFLKGSEEGVRKSALAGDQAAVLRTRVLTGRARANWIVTFRRPSRKQSVPPTRRGEKGSEARGAANATKATGHAQRVIQKWEVGKGSIFATNNVAYIKALDDLDNMTAAALKAARDTFRRHRIFRGARG
jgi:hypothetical protein